MSNALRLDQLFLPLAARQSPGATTTVIGLIKAIILPPACLLLLAFAGLWLRRRYARAGMVIAASSLGLLYLLSTPLLSSLALRSLESPYADPRAAQGAQAIVVVGGGTVGPAPEYGSDSVSALTLARVRYGARLQRMTGKPLLVSGGRNGKTSAEAAQMRAVMVDELNVPVRWMENRSVDTYTNALESHRILGPQGLTRIYLVTHAWHMPRARLAFEHAGFSVIAAPTSFTRFDFSDLGLGNLLPRASALVNSYYFCYEVLGYAVYMLRIRFSVNPGGEGNESSRQMG